MGDDHRGRTRGVTARDDVVQRPRNSAADEDDVPHEMVFAACSGGQRFVTTGYDQAGQVPGHCRLPLAGLAVHPMGECWLRVARGSAGGALPVAALRPRAAAVGPPCLFRCRRRDTMCSVTSRRAASAWAGAWASGTWLNPPPRAWTEGGDLLVAAASGSDLWRMTSYGFVHDSGHALLTPLPATAAVEVGFVVDYDQQFDQAGVLLRVNQQAWIKAGVEISDGRPQVGAVVTDEVSDWSVAPVPGWSGREVTVRASRRGNAVTVRARVESEPWQLVRVSPLLPHLPVWVGPYCCSPTRAGLVVRFRSAVLLDADVSLHPA